MSLLLAGAITALPVCPQTPRSEPSAPLLIRSGTGLVQLTVMAVGRNGAPVTDLTLNDFQIREQGQSKLISTFENNNFAAASGRASGAPRFGMFSNGSQVGSSGSVTVLLLDAGDTDRRDWELAWPQILSFLRSLRSDQHIAVYSLDGTHGLQILQDYDSGHERLLRSLQQAHATLATLLEFPAATNAPSRRPSFSQREDELTAPELLSFGRIQGLTAALRVIRNHLAAIAAPKSLIWFASAFPDPFQPVHGGQNSFLESYRLKLLRAINSLLLGDVAIYPVDARGLMPDHSFDAEHESIPVGPVGPGEQNSLFLYDFSILLELASRSGGKAYLNTNGFAQSFRNVVSTAEGSYTLGFYVSEPADNKFHSLRVSVRREGVNLRYRPGYWYFADTPTSQYEAEEELKTVLDSPFSAGAIQLQANAVRARSSARVLVTLYVDPRDVALAKRGDEWTGVLEIICGQKDSRNRVFAIPPREIPIDLPNRVKASGEWFKLEMAVALRSGSTVVRIAVRDEGSRRIGSVDVPLEDVRDHK